VLHDVPPLTGCRDAGAIESSCLTARRSVLPVPSVGIASTTCRSSRSVSTASAGPCGTAAPTDLRRERGVGVERDETLAFRRIGHRRDDARVVLVDERPHLILDLHVRTISPAILLNRDRRSVMRMNPASSIIAMSPVTYQPSRTTSLVFSGSSRYRAADWGR